MKKVIGAILVIIFLATFQSVSTGQNTQTLVAKKLKKKIRDKVKKALEAYNIPALSIGIIQHGKLVRVEGFGGLDRESKTLVDECALFQMGSDTKKFTAIIVNNLVLDNQLKIDTSIVAYLPEGVTKEAKEKLKKITLKSLLLHRAGIPNRAASNSRIDGDPMLVEYTEANLLYDLNHLSLDFEPDTDFSYSNLGYALVGYLCEQASGESYSELLKEYITDKYGMKNTFVYPCPKQLEWIVTPYRKDNKNIKSQPWKMGKMAPAGGIYSNVEDISKLMIAHIKAYRAFEETGVAEDPLLLTENDGIEGSHYGFGLAKNIDAYGVRYGHGGDLDGYASEYVFLPGNNSGLILLTSSGGQWFGELIKDIKMDALAP